MYPHAPAMHYGYPSPSTAGTQPPGAPGPHPAVPPAPPAGLVGAAASQPSSAGPVRSTGGHLAEDEDDYYYYDEGTL